jgi:ADP-heptose:LPS heptosyltransferase
MIKNKYVKFIINLIYYSVDTLLLGILSCNFIYKYKDKSRNKVNIAFVRMDNIGDFLLWGGCLDNLRIKFPNQSYKLTLFCNSSCYDLAFALNIFDEIIPISRNRYSISLNYRYRISKLVSRKLIDIAINPTYSKELIWSDSIIRFTFAAEKYGFSGSYTNLPIYLRFISNNIYSHLVDFEDSNKGEVFANAFFLNQIGVPSIPRLYDFKNFPEHHEFSIPAEKYFLVFPGASWSGRRWPTIKFAEFIEKISAKYSLTPIVCGFESDAMIADAIKSKVQVEIINLVGKTSFCELVPLVRSSKFIITNETGALFLAASLNVPAFCIVGGGHFNRFTNLTSIHPAPPVYLVNYYMKCYQCNWACQYKIQDSGPVPCIESITVLSALDAVDRYIFF